MNIYVVQNREGKYFRNIGYGGRGESWREKLEDAKFYTKIGQARARVTFWYKNYPQYGCPRIVAYTLGEENCILIDTTIETEKSIRRAEVKKLTQRVQALNRSLEQGKASKSHIEKDLQKIKDELAMLSA